MLSGDPAAVRAIDGSFAVVAVDGITVRMARSLDRPMRYFLAKRHEGPALFVADRIDTLQRALADGGLRRASSIRAIPAWCPAHYVVEIALVGCPDPDPVYTRFFTPARGTLPADLDEIGRRYIGALADEVAKWLHRHRSRAGGAEPIGVSFSGGIDSGSVFLVTYHTMLRLGLSPARLKAFVLDLGDGPDVEQARAFLGAARACRCSSKRSAARPTTSTSTRTLRVLEDYKSLDVECAAMGLRLCKGIRAALSRSGAISPTATAATRT